MGKLLRAISITICILIITVGCQKKEEPKDEIADNNTENITENINNEQEIESKETERGIKRDTDKDKDKEPEGESREPKSEAEIRAVEFLKESIETMMKPKDKEKNKAFVDEYADLELFYPLIPRSTKEVDIANMLVSMGIVDVREKIEGVQKEDRRYTLIDSIRRLNMVNDKNYIIDSYESPEDGCTVVIMEIHTKGGGLRIYEMRLKLGKNNRWVILPGVNTEDAEKQAMIEPVVFMAPKGSEVKLNGELIIPKTIYQDKDVYEIENIYYTYREDISVNMGNGICIIDGFLEGSVSGSITGEDFEGSAAAGGSVVDKYDLITDLNLLSITGEQYRGLKDELGTVINTYVQKIGSLLDNNDFEGLTELMAKEGKMEEDKKYLEACFRDWKKAEDKAELLTGATREIIIQSINMSGDGKALAEIATKLTPKNGNACWSTGKIMLEKQDNEWKIYNISRELFRRDSAHWAPIEE